MGRKRNTRPDETFPLCFPPTLPLSPSSKLLLVCNNKISSKSSTLEVVPLASLSFLFGFDCIFWDFAVAWIPFSPAQQQAGPLPLVLTMAITLILFFFSI
jgi:hypothetical protein